MRCYMYDSVLHQNRVLPETFHRGLLHGRRDVCAHSNGRCVAIVFRRSVQRTDTRDSQRGLARTNGCRIKGRCYRNCTRTCGLVAYKGQLLTSLLPYRVPDQNVSDSLVGCIRVSDYMWTGELWIGSLRLLAGQYIPHNCHLREGLESEPNLHTLRGVSGCRCALRLDQ